MKLTPYLQFSDGNCRAALDFYADALGGRVSGSMTFGETPGGAPVGPDWHDKVMHAQFEADGLTLYACDAPPEYQRQPAGLALTLNVDTPEDAERVFAALGEGGSITMAMDETFWAERFGMLTDRFGMPWIISCDKPMA